MSFGHGLFDAIQRPPGPETRGRLPLGPGCGELGSLFLLSDSGALPLGDKRALCRAFLARFPFESFFGHSTFATVKTDALRGLKPTLSGLLFSSLKLVSQEQ